MDTLIDHHSEAARDRDSEVETRVCREIEADIARGRTFRTNPPPAMNTIAPAQYARTNVRTVYYGGMPKEIWDEVRIK